MNDRLSLQDYRTIIASDGKLAASPGVGAARALGRLPVGTMNKTEEAYAAHLDLRKQAGEALWWSFESVTFKIASDCRYTPDFLVLLADGRLEAHEVKGNWFLDDAKVKIKVAASHFPIRFVAIRKVGARDGGGWSEEEF